MSEARLRELARSLAAAWDGARAIPAPSTSLPSLTIDQAYEIQDLLIGARIESDRDRAGWKMGLTSAEPPATPIVGSLLSDMVVASGSSLDLGSMVAPMVEAELVVRIGEVIDRPTTLAKLEAGPHEVGPGIEVIDYRTTGSSGVIDWIADNSTVAYAVVGDFVPVADTSPGEITAALYGEGKHLASGEGRLVMGNPLEAVAWLSGHLMGRGLRLEPGHVVLTGSLTGHHEVPGDSASMFTADFGTFGSVSVHFRV